MYGLGIDNRSDNDYSQPDDDVVESPRRWSDILLFPLAVLLLFALPLLHLFALIAYFFSEIYASIKAKIRGAEPER